MRICKKKREWKLVTKSIVEMNKSCVISLRKGRYKGFGQVVNRSMNLEYYRIRDDYRALLYSAVRLLIKLRESGEVSLFKKHGDLLINSPFIRLLCIDNVLSKSGAFAAGTDGRKGLIDKEVDSFVYCKVEMLNQYDYDVKRV